MIENILSRNFITISSLGLTVIAAFTGGNSMMEEFTANKDLEARSKRAEYIFKSGCEMVVTGVYPNISTGVIHKDLVVTHRKTGLPLPEGTRVCDGFGNASVLGKDGRPTEIFFTGNRDLVADRERRFVGSKYAQPVTKGE